MASAALTQQERGSFVSALQLPPMSPALAGLGGALALFRGVESPAVLDAGSVLSFIGDISSQARQDVLNSTLVAQLSADKNFDRGSDTAKWYSFYVNVLEHIGWVTQASNFTQYDAHGQNLDVDKAVLEILAAVASQNELAAITAAINGAKALADGDGRITLFDHFAAKNQVGMFQLGAASEQNGAVAFKLGSFTYTSSSSVTKVLWFRFSTKNTQLRYNCQSITLNQAVYGQVRDNIAQKLGQMATDYVANLSL